MSSFQVRLSYITFRMLVNTIFFPAPEPPAGPKIPEREA